MDLPGGYGFPRIVRHAAISTCVLKAFVLKLGLREDGKGRVELSVKL